MRQRRLLPIAALLFIGAAIALIAAADIAVDWLWFRSLGFGAVFATTWSARLAVFAAVTGVSWVFMVGNGLLAARAGIPPVRRLRLVRDGNGSAEVPITLEISLDRVPWGLLVLAAGSVVSVCIGLIYASMWEDALKWWYAVPFGRTDPLFDRDVAFYVFALPIYSAACEWALVAVVLAAIVAAVVHWGRGAIELGEGPPRLHAAAARHLSALLALLLLIKAGDYLLQRYGLLLSRTGVLFGAAYTDVHVRLPLLTVSAVVCVVAALLAATATVLRDVRLPTAALVLVIAASLIGWIVPSVVQSYRVKPDELRLESPYIASNIEWTRYGFGLDHLTAKEFPAEGQLTPAVLAANDTTIQNLRWWDPRPLLDTYRQLQEIRLYYDFHDIDVDRYIVDGTNRQVMLAARELDQSRLPADAQTWINQHFKFTHGIGVAMSPVNRFDAEGLPIFFVQDIPPVSPIGLQIDRAGIYFGEETADYVIVGGDSKEFDYPRGQDNVYTTYQGADGVPLDSVARRALFAWWVGDIKLLISSNVTAATRMLFHRRIADRIGRLAPFLILDRDPYLVISDGRLVWLQDAYTVSSALPYSEQVGHGDINYIRNSVKITVDAYDGTVRFYIVDPSDPLVRTYARIFPSLFEPLEHLAPALRRHLRYPEDLFVLQAGVYSTYHMTDPEVFYNKEDLWSIPERNHGGHSARMEPYYTIMRLPGEPTAEFILMLPMVPNQRDNMIAWLAARCDDPNYGAVIEFRFPKDKLIYGPAQIEARIDQDTGISQQLSLWNQTGSRVIRGNLLVIPIDDALLYVEPLYLSAENRQLPELKRLIASYGDHVAMSQQVEPLFAALFAHGENAPAIAGIGGVRPESSAAALPAGAAAGTNAAALDHYRRAVDELRRGSWEGFGREMDALKQALETADTRSSGAAP